MTHQDDLLTIKHKLNASNIQVVHVVAFDNQRCIGKDNQLAWHIPEDLQHFKKITTGGVVLMGRKTFESIGKALPNRINWVITNNTTWMAHDVKVAHDLTQALWQASDDVAQSAQKNNLFILGGGEIFKQTLAIADRLYISRIDITVMGDAFYPPILPDFQQISQNCGISQNNGIKFCFEQYERQK